MWRTSPFYAQVPTLQLHLVYYYLYIGGGHLAVVVQVIVGALLRLRLLHLVYNYLYVGGGHFLIAVEVVGIRHLLYICEILPTFGRLIFLQCPRKYEQR